MIYKELIKRIVEIDYKYKHGFLPSSCSALPIIKEIYTNFNKNTDIFILSKGHAAMALYVVLEEFGFHPNVSQSHLHQDLQNNIFCSTGSLGHGLPIAIGVALAKRIKNELGITHVLLGDGECQEGTTWESILLIKKYQLLNIRIHIDGNGYQGMQTTDRYPANLLRDILPNGIVSHYRYPKGYGIPLIEDKPIHTFKMSDEDYKVIMEQLK